MLWLLNHSSDVWPWLGTALNSFAFYKHMKFYTKTSQAIEIKGFIANIVCSIVMLLCIY